MFLIDDQLTACCFHQVARLAAEKFPVLDLARNQVRALRNHAAKYEAARLGGVERLSDTCKKRQGIWFYNESKRENKKEVQEDFPYS